ncbi:MAG: succinate dehydrogenase assembly factor 2 [Methylovulum miyakonense]|uniref:FAD assembly factor SdhE n=1 Tax=Methylovulum miyakonense TaxID=645578 RepID=UPI003BB67834
MELAKLKWQCRRGSLELDLLLKHYLDTAYLQADNEEKARFVELLKLDDEILLEIFTANRLQATRPENR